PNDRWQGISDVSRQLRWLQSSLSAGKSGTARLPSGVIAPRPAASRARWIALGVAAAVAMAAIGGLIGARWFGSAAPASSRSLRLHSFFLPPEGHVFDGR